MKLLATSARGMVISLLLFGASPPASHATCACQGPVFVGAPLDPPELSKIVRVCDSASGFRIEDFAETPRISEMLFAKGGDLLVLVETAPNAYALRRHDPISGALVSSVPIHPFPSNLASLLLSDAALSPDGQLYVGGSRTRLLPTGGAIFEALLLVVDPETGEVLDQFSPQRVPRDLTFTSRGLFYIALRDDLRFLHVFRAEDGAACVNLPSNSLVGSMTSLAGSQFLLLGSEETVHFVATAEAGEECVLLDDFIPPLAWRNVPGGWESVPLVGRGPLELVWRDTPSGRQYLYGVGNRLVPPNVHTAVERM